MRLDDTELVYGVGIRQIIRSQIRTNADGVTIS